MDDLAMLMGSGLLGKNKGNPGQIEAGVPY